MIDFSEALIQEIVDRRVIVFQQVAFSDKTYSKASREFD